MLTVAGIIYYIFTDVSLTYIILIAAAVPRTYIPIPTVRRRPSMRVYAKKSFSGFYSSSTKVHHRLYIQIYYMKYAICDSFFSKILCIDEIYTYIDDLITQ